MEKQELKYEYYQRVLREEFARRVERNSRYSLRAYARSLGISHSGLSKILSGKRELSLKTAVALAEKLALDKESMLHFLVSAARRPLPLSGP